MKFKLSILFKFWMVFTQEDFDEYTIKAPNVATLMDVRNINLNEAQGKAIVSLPLYAIILDDLKIPLFLIHIAEGTKVEYEFS